MKFGLSDRVLKQINDVLAQHPKIDKAVVFGSRAKGTEKPGSDIDLAIFAPEIDDSEFASLWAELDDLPILFKMDLVHFEQLTRPALRDEIVAEGVPLHEN